MIYFDYSATTKTDERVLKRFNEINEKYFFNPNSSYNEALKSKEIIIDATNTLANFFNVNPTEVIYTSGASEANNTAIKGLAFNTNKKHIITTKLEHSSVVSTMNYLQSLGYKIDFVNLKDGRVDFDSLKLLINEDTFLVSVCAVDSEMGIRQPIEEIGELLKNYEDIYFHSDITQAVGKVNIDLTNVDLASFSGHKIFGFKGIGALIKKDYVKLIPLIHGGKSTTIYRSGTPQTELIDSLKTSIDLIGQDIDKNYQYVASLKDRLIGGLKKYQNIKINSNKYSIPNILNISILGYNSNSIQRYLASKNIFVSTKTACALNDDYSLVINYIYDDLERASSSIRISLSYKTTIEEVDEFLSILDGMLNESN